MRTLSDTDVKSLFCFELLCLMYEFNIEDNFYVWPYDETYDLENNLCYNVHKRNLELDQVNSKLNFPDTIFLVCIHLQLVLGHYKWQKKYYMNWPKKLSSDLLRISFFSCFCPYLFFPKLFMSSSCSVGC